MSAASTIEALAPINRAVAEVYGVAYPNDLAQTRVATWLRRLQITPTGTRITSAQVQTAIAALRQRDVITAAEHGAGYRCQPDFQGLLTLSAHAGARLLPLLQIIEQDLFQQRYDMPPQQLQMRVRVLAIAGRFADLKRLGALPYGAWQFLAAPEMAPTLHGLPDELRFGALYDCLFRAIQRPAPVEHLIDAVSGSALQPVILIDLLAFLFVLLGRMDEAADLFDPARLQARVTAGQNAKLAPAIIARYHSVLALKALLEGQIELAAAQLDAALEAERGATRKRNLFVDSPSFALALLALVKLDSTESRALLDRCLRTADKQGAWPELTRCVAAGAGARTDSLLQVYWPATDAPGLDTMLKGLVRCWRGDFAGTDWPAHQQALERCRAQAQTHGYRWLASECAAITQRAAAERNPEATPQPAPAGSLTGLLAPQAQWEYSLKALEDLAVRARPAAARRPARSRRRLAWRVEVSDYGSVLIEPLEQRMNKDGQWSRGRAVALKRLRSEAPTLDYLLDQDRAAAGRITEEKVGWGYQRQTRLYLDERALLELAGHPHVLNAAAEAVTVTRIEPELTLSDQSGAQILARIVPYNAEGKRYLAVPRDPTRIDVVHFSADHLRLFDIIPGAGLTLPGEAKERLLEAVAALAGQLRISSDVDGGAAHSAIEVDADPEPWVQLVPAAGGLTVTLMVEPVPGSATYFPPGQGGDTVFVAREGGNVRARRDLAAERAALAQLRQACPALDQNGYASAQDRTEPSDGLTLATPEQCLALIAELQQFSARCLWPQGQPFQVVAHADAGALQLTIKPADQWFAASGELRIDDTTVLGLERLFALLDEHPRSRFLELDSGRFLALGDSFRRQLDELKALSGPVRAKGARLHPLASLALSQLFDAAEVEAAAAWHDVRERLRRAEATTAELPTTLQADLRPYQIDGFRWLARLGEWGVGAALADDMGLGKTLQALALLVLRAVRGPALVVAPTSVAGNWISEARRFAPTLNLIDYASAPRRRASALDGLGAFDLVIATYGLLQRDLDSFSVISWDSVLLDEAQAIKNAATQRARAVRELQAAFRIVTTGTPIENNLMELHSLFAFLNPGYLGSAAQFRERFVGPIERAGDQQVRQRLQRLIAPFMLRRRKRDVLPDLPARTEITLSVTLSEPEAALYEALRRRALSDLSGQDQSAGAGAQHLKVLAHLMRLRLACCHPRLVKPTWRQGSAKLEVFARTIDELLSNDHKVLVFSQFVKHLQLLEAHLTARQIPFQYLDGSTTARERNKRIAEFQAGVGEVFLISLKAGGTGLNLTAADYVIHMDPWWNPAVEDQASDRAHRIGQTRPVTIYRLVASGTIEEQIVDLHHRKRDLADRLLEDGSAAASLSAAELLTLLREGTVA